VRDGRWQLLECTSAWDGNSSADGFVAFAWELDGERLLVAVNQAAGRGQCHVRLPFTDLARRPWRLRDELGPAVYDRDGSELQAHGLFLDEPAWHASVFSLTPVE
jgi:FAD/FMN-containing dehydrogenase